MQLDDAAFRKLFSGSPVKRIGRNRFLRNVLIATGNSNNEDLLPAVRALLDDGDPVVRGAAVWALRRLAPAKVVEAERAARFAEEPDPDVARRMAVICPSLFPKKDLVP